MQLAATQALQEPRRELGRRGNALRAVPAVGRALLGDYGRPRRLQAPDRGHRVVDAPSPRHYLGVHQRPHGLRDRRPRQRARRRGGARCQPPGAEELQGLGKEIRGKKEKEKGGVCSRPSARKAVHVCIFQMCYFQRAGHTWWGERGRDFTERTKDDERPRAASRLSTSLFHAGVDQRGHERGAASTAARCDEVKVERTQS